jgi:hypothetical protein
MGRKITLSICTYNDGLFEVIINDKETGEGITFSGNKKIDNEQLAFINRIAPACVWTTYKRTTQED